MSARTQRGFSIVELMVAMAISLVLFAGALSIYLSSKSTSGDNERMSRLQEAGRIALDVVARDLRNAGYHACVRLDPDRFLNRLNNGPNSMLWDFGRPVTGYDANGGAWVTGGDAAAFDASLLVPAPTAGNDIVVMRTPARDGNNLRIDAAGGESLPLDVRPPPAGFAPVAGEIWMVTDCEYTGVFQVSAFNANQVFHAAGGGPPGNATDSLEARFTAVAELLPLRAAIYWIAPSDTGNGPALWRRVGNDPAEELLEGVERMQFLYGLDPNEDGVIDRYVNARDVVRWRDVVAVQVAMLIRTPTEDGTLTDTATYQLLDDAVFNPADDRRQRALFSTTVTLRNRTL